MISNGLKEWMKKVNVHLAMDDKTWAYSILAKDPLYQRMDPSRRQNIINHSLACAAVEERVLRERYGVLSPREYAARLGVKVLPERSEISRVFPYFALYNSELPAIWISVQSIEAVENMILYQFRDILDQVNLTELAVAHELFHHIEKQDPGIYTRTKQIELLRFKKFSHSVCVLSASEIAARHFSKLLTGLKFSPTVYEVLLSNAK